MVEDGEPAYVVLPYREYERLLEGCEEKKEAGIPPKEKTPEPLTNYELLEKINRDIEIWKASQEKAEEGVAVEKPLEEPDIQIERIPY